MIEFKEGDKVYVNGCSTPGHERPGFFGTVSSVSKQDNGRILLTVQSRFAPNGSNSIEWAHHCSR